MSRDADDRARHDADALRPDQQGQQEDADELHPGPEPAAVPRAAPAGSVPDDQAEGVEPMPEVPGGPQVDVPAAQGHLDAGDSERRP